MPQQLYPFIRSRLSIGAGVFVTTVVAGVIAVVCPFDAMQRPFLRDVIFYLAAAFWTFYILWKKTITKFEALGENVIFASIAVMMIFWINIFSLLETGFFQSLLTYTTLLQHSFCLFMDEPNN